MYFDLGLSDESVAMERKRVDIARRLYGNDSLQLAQALTDLGSSLHESTSVREREAVLIEAKRILDQRRDFRSMDRASLDIALAQHYESSDLNQAFEYATQAVAVYREHPRDPMLSEAIYQQAIIFGDLGQPRQAEPLLKEAIQVSAAKNGDPNGSSARFYAYLGQMQQNLAEFAGAEESLRRALAAARKINGEDHIDTLETELRLGIFLGATSRTAEGLEHIERAKQILLRTRGADDPFFAPQVFLEYGRSLANAGRWEEGLDYVLKAVENRRKNRPGTQYLAQMLLVQASILLDMGRYSEAQRVLDEADEIAKKVNYPTSYLAADERARLLIATVRAQEADSALDTFHPSSPVPGALEMDSFRLHVSRAEHALARGDNELAARLAQGVRQELSATNARDYLKWLEARAAFVEGRALLNSGRARDALPLLQRAVELRKASVDAVSPVLAQAQIGLADCYLALGDRSKARDFADSAKNALGSHHELGRQYLVPLQDLENRLRQVTLSATRG